ncbi:hypothetical protein I3760_12G037700 [Carya illinoinensis]|nr:hypothetical protein I3760_12G037700 [Carya illinoinensis]
MHEFVGEEKNDDARVQCSLQLEKASDKKGWFDIHNSDMAKLGLIMSCATSTNFHASCSPPFLIKSDMSNCGCQ